MSGSNSGLGMARWMASTVGICAGSRSGACSSTICVGSRRHIPGRPRCQGVRVDSRHKNDGLQSGCLTTSVLGFLDDGPQGPSHAHRRPRMEGIRRYWFSLNNMGDIDVPIGERSVSRHVMERSQTSHGVETQRGIQSTPGFESWATKLEPKWLRSYWHPSTHPVEGFHFVITWGWKKTNKCGPLVHFSPLSIRIAMTMTTPKWKPKVLQHKLATKLTWNTRRHNSKKNACVFLIPFYVFNFSIHGHSCNPIHFQSCTHGSCFSGSSLWSNSFLLDFIVVWVEGPETTFRTYILKTFENPLLSSNHLPLYKKQKLHAQTQKEQVNNNTPSVQTLIYSTSAFF